MIDRPKEDPVVEELKFQLEQQKQRYDQLRRAYESSCEVFTTISRAFSRAQQEISLFSEACEAVKKSLEEKGLLNHNWGTTYSLYPSKIYDLYCREREKNADKSAK